MSTIEELAANLMKREQQAEALSVSTAAQDALGWDELMPFAVAEERRRQQLLAALSEAPVARPASRMTVLRLIQGGLA